MGNSIDAHASPYYDHGRGMEQGIIVRPFTERDARQVYEAIQESGEHLSRWLPGINASLSLNDIRT